MKPLSFSEKVYAVVRKIPKGTVLTYKQVAIKAGSPRAFRAVGAILHRNNSAEIPCHRVIKSNGMLGGYNRGVSKKKQMLTKEEVVLAKKDRMR
ncbi:MAG: MGMT family protein [Candidatus Pacebacteria bacterium]|nr:MGMT family protein [Candidatus Paceibacterota bacterium]